MCPGTRRLCAPQLHTASRRINASSMVAVRAVVRTHPLAPVRYGEHAKRVCKGVAKGGAHQLGAGALRTRCAGALRMRRRSAAPTSCGAKAGGVVPSCCMRS